MQYVQEHNSLPPLHQFTDEAAIVKECVDASFLENVKAVPCLDGSVRISSTRPFVTKKGLDFLCKSPYEETYEGRHEALLKSIAENTEELEALRRISDSSEKRVLLAKKEAEAAKKEARFSKIMSVLALLVSIGSLAVAVLALIA